MSVGFGAERRAGRLRLDRFTARCKGEPFPRTLRIDFEGVSNRLRGVERIFPWDGAAGSGNRFLGQLWPSAFSARLIVTSTAWREPMRWIVFALAMMASGAAAAGDRKEIPFDHELCLERQYDAQVCTNARTHLDVTYVKGLVGDGKAMQRYGLYLTSGPWGVERDPLLGCAYLTVGILLEGDELSSSEYFVAHCAGRTAEFTDTRDRMAQAILKVIGPEPGEN